MLNSLQRLSLQAHWLLRAGFSAVFLFHGIGKIATFNAFAEMTGLSVPVAAFVTVAEIAAGLGMLIGGFGSDAITRLSALASIPVLIGAIAMIHWPRWSFTPGEGFPMGGMEFQVVLLLIALYFLVVGNREVVGH